MSNEGLGIKPPSFVFSFLMILLLFSKKVQCTYSCDRLGTKLIVLVGNISFGIYLIHNYIIYFVDYFIGNSSWAIRWLLTLLLALLIVLLGRNLLPQRLTKIIDFSWFKFLTNISAVVAKHVARSVQRSVSKWKWMVKVFCIQLLIKQLARIAGYVKRSVHFLILVAKKAHWGFMLHWIPMKMLDSLALLAVSSVYSQKES